MHKVHQFGVFLCTGQTHRKAISFDLQRGRKRGCPGGHDWVTSWDLEKISLHAEIRKKRVYFQTERRHFSLVGIYDLQ